MQPAALCRRSPGCGLAVLLCSAAVTGSCQRLSPALGGEIIPDSLTQQKPQPRASCWGGCSSADLGLGISPWDWSKADELLVWTRDGIGVIAVALEWLDRGSLGRPHHSYKWEWLELCFGRDESQLRACRAVRGHTNTWGGVVDVCCKLKLWGIRQNLGKAVFRYLEEVLWESSQTSQYMLEGQQIRAQAIHEVSGAHW